MPSRARGDHDAVAAMFRALAEPARLQIVHTLSTGERCVRELVTELGLAQSTTSAHLATLRTCGLVSARTQGRSSYYSLTTPALVALVHNAADLLERSRRADRSEDAEGPGEVAAGAAPAHVGAQPQGGAQP